MKLTSKGRYAVTAVLDLAFHAEQGPVSLAHISRRQDISLSYLEQLFTRLRKHGLVISTRGPVNLFSEVGCYFCFCSRSRCCSCRLV